MPEALLHGDGLAVSACSALLRRAGWEIGHRGPARPRLPVVLLNAQSQQLLTDVFEQPGLLEDWHPIERRIVRWGAETIELPHASLAVNETALLERVGEATGSIDAADYQIYGAKSVAGETAFGERLAELAAIDLQPGVNAHTCWVEAMAGGWLFAVGINERRAWLIGVGAAIHELLEQSELVRPIVGEQAQTISGVATQPRLAHTLTGEHWLACGSAAMAFDPICGEGTGHALREAILGCAVLKAHARGEAWGDLAQLYEQRLRGGFARHIDMCHQLYATGGDSAWWREQLASLTPMHVAMPRAQFRLNGFDLERLG